MEGKSFRSQMKRSLFSFEKYIKAKHYIIYMITLNEVLDKNFGIYKPYKLE